MWGAWQGNCIARMHCKYLQSIHHHLLLCPWENSQFNHSIFPLNFHWTLHRSTGGHYESLGAGTKWNLCVILRWKRPCPLEQILAQVRLGITGKLHCRAGIKNRLQKIYCCGRAFFFFLTRIMSQNKTESRSMFTSHLLLNNILSTYWVHQSLFLGNQYWQNHRERKWQWSPNESVNKHKHTGVYKVWPSL